VTQSYWKKEIADSSMVSPLNAPSWQIALHNSPLPKQKAWFAECPIAAQRALMKSERKTRSAGLGVKTPPYSNPWLTHTNCGNHKVLSPDSELSKNDGQPPRTCFEALAPRSLNNARINRSFPIGRALGQTSSPFSRSPRCSPLLETTERINSDLTVPS
jgi:hypothetical protein